MRKRYNIQGYFPYENRVKKAKFRKRALAIALTIVLGSTVGYILDKNFRPKGNGEMIPISTEAPKDKDIYPTMPPVVETAIPTVTLTVEPTVAPTATPEPIITNDDGYNRGDSVVTTEDVRMRLNTTTESFKMGVLPRGSVVNRILTDGEWDLIRYGDQIAYVHSDYTREYDVDYNQDYYHVERYSDIARTTSKLYCRLGPSTDEKDLFLLNKNEEVVVIGKATPYNNPNDVWYLVRARGKIGYVNAGYTKSLRSHLQTMGISMDEVKIQKLGYMKGDNTVYDQYGNPIGYLDDYQLLEVLQKEKNRSLIQCDGVVGYVTNGSIKNLDGSFLTSDISSQRVYYYVNNDVAFQGRITTGKKGTPTDIGCFRAYGKSDHHDFGHDGYEATILWLPYNGGEGFHDAKWEDDKHFGDYNYAMKHGSLGCDRTDNETAQLIYDNVPSDVQVLVKE